MKIRMILLAAVFAMTGCAMKPRPPVFNLYERERIVVLPFQNSTHDKALGPAIQDEILVSLVQLNAAPVAEQGQVTTMIEDMAKKSGASEESLRKQLAETFKCDVIMVGSVNTYSESLDKSDPRRIKASYKHDTYKWGYSDEASVRIDATLKLIDARNGNILWIRKVPGAGRVSRWQDLPWPGENTTPPPPVQDGAAPAGGDRSVKGGKGLGKGDPHQPPAQEPPAQQPTAAAPAAQQPITIIINNTQQNQQQVQQQVEQKVEQKQEQSQQQEQKQEQAQAQGAAEGVAASPRKLLYESDSNVFRARQFAIDSVVRNAMRDFRGRGGWYPGIEEAQKSQGAPQKK